MRANTVINFQKDIIDPIEANQVAKDIKVMMAACNETLERDYNSDEEYIDIMEDAHLLELKSVIQARRLSEESYKEHGLFTLFGCSQDKLKVSDF